MIEEVQPWGAVFGGCGKGAKAWRFLLQENATIVHRWSRDPADAKTVSRPMVLREVFPNAVAGGSVRLRKSWKSLPR